NILISDGNAVVADFGIARAISVSGGEALTQTGMAIGTPSYMSPEQALGAQDVDGRTDIYALGCVFYEMLNGRPAFGGKTPQAILSQSITGDRPKLEEDPLKMQPVLEKAMAKEPDDRFQTGGELRSALTSGTLKIETGVSKRTVWIGGGVAAVVVVVLAILAFWPSGYSIDGNPRHSLIIFPFENRTGDAGNDYLQEASMNLLGFAVSNWEDLRVYDDERTNSLMRKRDIEEPADVDFQIAQEMARDARVGTLVLGDIRRERDSIAIEAKLHDVASGERVGTEIIRAAYETDPRPLFDSLATRILQVSGAPAGVRPELVAQTTQSLEAYRAYLRGVEALQVFQTDTATKYLLRAVDLDSTFALAYMRLRDVDGWIGIESSSENRREWMSKAQAHSGNLPPRLRQLLQFHVAYESGEFQLARQIVEALIEHDSTDAEAWYQLGEAHFHDQATNVFYEGEFHPDTLGNLGIALYAFRRTLEIDSRYMMAYQHILDCLDYCSRDRPWVCLEDSAVYARREELEERFGSERLEAMRSDAHEQRTEAAHDWVNAVPFSNRARAALVQILHAEGRMAEFRSQTSALRATGDTVTARYWEAIALLEDMQYGPASDTIAAAFEDPDAIDSFLQGDPAIASFAMLSGGGRQKVAEKMLVDFSTAIVNATPEANLFGMMMPSELVLPATFLLFSGNMYIGVDSLTHMGLEWLGIVDSLWGDDEQLYAQILVGSGLLILNTYLATKDSTLLSALLQRYDTTQGGSWQVFDAHLGLDRGDTARATARLEWLESADHASQFGGNFGMVRVFAWADLMARLGMFADAASLFAAYDSTDARMNHPGLHVRTYVERGALYQQLGNPELALEMYELFVEAWNNADPPLQPLVEQARAAIAALRGEIQRERG
ncbi:MAG: serine/threonine-protein kinase, partial [Myxococcota bacterium]|nr:serine/threonine-protein kinase [Myxococcota bacterium]